MSVILHEAAIAALLDTQQGPVGRLVERVAGAVVEAERENVRGYFGTAPSLHGRVDQEIGFVMDGSTAVIGIRDGGNKAQRLARKEADGSMDKGFLDALDRVRAFFGGV